MSKINIEDRLTSFLEDLDRVDDSIKPILAEYDKALSKIDDKLDDIESPVLQRKLSSLRDALDKEFQTLAKTLLEVNKAVEPYEN